MDIIEQFFETHGLNNAQRQAVETTEEFIRLTAGAGSGKTRALATRYVYLTDILGIAPDNILCITFTRKAAQEMKKRIARSSTIQAESARISTYHGFCHSVIKEEGHRMHLKKEFRILDESEQDKLLRKIYKNLQYTIKDGEMKKVSEVLGCYKSQRDYVGLFDGMHSRTFDDNLALFSEYLLPVLQSPQLGLTEDEIIRFEASLSQYLSYQVKESSFDFMDLLYLTLHLFAHDEHVLRKWQERMQYIMVDEYQDSSRIEEELLVYLSGRHKNLFVVGDPDQSIYSFKGGDIDVFLDFGKTFNMSHDLLLTENYRSISNIVHLSNELIQKNTNRIDKVSLPIRVEGNKPIHFHCKKDAQELQFIVDKVKTLIASGDYTYKDIAVILRTHRSKKPIEQAFVKAGYPYTIADGLKFYAKSEIKVALAYIRMLLEDDDRSFLTTINLPSRRVGEVLKQKIEAVADKNLCSFYAALKILQLDKDVDFTKTKADEYIETIEFMRERKDQVSLSTLVSDLLRMSGYLRYLREGANEIKIDNVEDLIESVRLLEERRQQEVSLVEYVGIIDEFTREAEEDEAKDEIQIMTMHSSKGLEFKVVFLPLFNDGNIPSSKSTSNIKALEEERRLAYVAFTRAEDLLIISDSEGLSERGANKRPSRFLFDFNRSQLEEPIPIPQKQVQLYKDSYGNNKLVQDITERGDIQVGNRIQHAVFGTGVIKAIDTKNYLISFEKLGTDRSIAKHIPIKVISSDKDIKAQPAANIDKQQNALESMQSDNYKVSSSYQVDADESSIASTTMPTHNDIPVAVKNPEAVQNAAQTITKTAVEHPIWGTGFIKETHDHHIVIRFPEINESKRLPKDNDCIKML